MKICFMCLVFLFKYIRQMTIIILYTWMGFRGPRNLSRLYPNGLGKIPTYKKGWTGPACREGPNLRGPVYPVAPEQKP